MKNFSFHRIALLVAVLTSIVLLGGCGSGSSDSTSSSQPNVSERPPQAHPALAAKGKRGKGSETKRRDAHKDAFGDWPVTSRENQDRKGGGEKRIYRHRGTGVERVHESLEELLPDAADEGRHVVSSKEQIRKIVEELQEGSPEKGSDGESEQGSNAVANVVEEVLGRR